MEISDFALRKIALCTAVAGVAMLLFLSVSSRPKEVSIPEINSGLEGQKVITSGIVEWRRYSNSALLFTLEDRERISAVLFNPDASALAAVERGAALRVNGTVQIYKGKPEIVVEGVFALGVGNSDGG